MTSSDKKDSKAVAAEESARLRELWEAAEAGRLSQSEFGEKYGIGGQSAVGNFLHGRSLLSMKAALGFARGLGVSLESFSPRLASEAIGISSAVSVPGPVMSTYGVSLYPPVLAFQTPLLRELRATAHGHVEQSMAIGFEKLVVAMLTQDSHAYAARIRGDGFFPRYRAGEFLILSKTPECVQGADMLVQMENGPLLLMQFNWRRDDEVQLLPLNGNGPPMTVAVSDVEWTECVVGVANPNCLQPNPYGTKLI